MDISPSLPSANSSFSELISQVFTSANPPPASPPEAELSDSLTPSLSSDQFTAQQGQPTPGGTYSALRPLDPHRSVRASDGLLDLLRLLGSIQDQPHPDGSFLLRIRQSAAFAMQARGVMNSLPDVSRQQFGGVSRGMINGFLKDARVLFKTMVEFARQARMLGLKDQPLLAKFLKVARKILDLFPELLDPFIPAFASAQAGETGGPATDFLNSMGWHGAELSASAQVSMAAAFLAEIEIILDTTSGQISLSASSVEVHAIHAELSIRQADPIIVGLSGDGPELDPALPFVPFDITGDGVPEPVQLPGPGSPLLAADFDGNKVIDGGRELFGTQNGAENGFEELAKHDSNRDRIIDFLDPIFDRLLLFTDLNLDGKSQPHELTPLAAAGISALLLDYADLAKDDDRESPLAQQAQFKKDDGSMGYMWDVLLNYIPA